MSLVLAMSVADILFVDHVPSNETLIEIDRTIIGFAVPIDKALKLKSSYQPWRIENIQRCVIIVFL